MTGFAISGCIDTESERTLSLDYETALLKGEILVRTRSHSDWGGAVTASMYLPMERKRVWQQLTDYPRWVSYFPDLIRSDVLSSGDGLAQKPKRLYQVARKAFLLFTAQVEIYLRVVETVQSNAWQQIQFQMEQGSFTDFSADLRLQDHRSGTLLTYSVQATPLIPVPSILIQEAMRLDLPANMRRMRQVLCSSAN